PVCTSTTLPTACTSAAPTATSMPSTFRSSGGDMRRVAIACGRVAVTLAAGADAPEAARPPVASAQIQLGETADGACRGRTTQFILDHVRDLHVCVVYRNVAGLLVQRLKFTGPDGNVYQVL